ncbi:hypothetical protein [Paludisphaera rhizosphaerae]|uniref:hypothetical protein n=1 Tax=Paludisphaera rhizosphaerae TaxID=2711216 RepID=UPI0013EA37BF|nr:hypothetical protein [Paludisphaera rhizosphaerae]
MPPSTVVPLAGIALPAIIVPLVIFAKQAGNKRYYRHLERMAAIKAGVPLPESAPLPGPGAIVAIGAGVPIAAVFGALLATANLPQFNDDTVPLVAIIWSFALLIALVGLATALVLSVMLHRAHRRTAETSQPSTKPAYDPDMFEPAGRHF